MIEIRVELELGTIAEGRERCCEVPAVARPHRPVVLAVQQKRWRRAAAGEGEWLGRRQVVGREDPLQRGVGERQEVVRSGETDKALKSARLDPGR